ncbi:MAG: hypothetical protein EXR73_13855 [Myxococcales bacterium]|nr:hypothetical protein [Myxococcales bacterium]
MNVTKAEYGAAIDFALTYVTSGATDEIPHPSVARMSAILAWAWDSTGSTPETLDGVLALDLALQGVALRLIVGRCYHHRPTDHPRCEEIETNYYRASRGTGSRR